MEFLAFVAQHGLLKQENTEDPEATTVVEGTTCDPTIDDTCVVE